MENFLPQWTEKLVRDNKKFDILKFKIKVTSGFYSESLQNGEKAQNGEKVQHMGKLGIPA